jgi:hypothetical protein
LAWLFWFGLMVWKSFRASWRFFVRRTAHAK